MTIYFKRDSYVVGLNVNEPRNKYKFRKACGVGSMKSSMRKKVKRNL